VLAATFSITTPPARIGGFNLGVPAAQGGPTPANVAHLQLLQQAELKRQ
jgi:hypothetical protein